MGDDSSANDVSSGQMNGCGEGAGTSSEDMHLLYKRNFGFCYICLGHFIMSGFGYLLVRSCKVAVSDPKFSGLGMIMRHRYPIEFSLPE